MPDTQAGLMTIFGEALELPDPHTRAAYLEHACAGDSALRQRVEALLAAHAQAGGFLEPGLGATGAYEAGQGQPTHTLPGASPPAGDIPELETGSVIGRYTLLEVIGGGGMGRVYLAGQTEPVRRQVALKVIKAGMGSKAMLARFDAERQALALMDHPNIARVFDGGTTEQGQPFFVMELVRGVPLTRYCDEHRLSVRDRLGLFVQVCQAVQHAHQKGVIHRDIKPSNVLVTEVDGRPTPKVIDFGLAKATEQKLTDLSLADAGVIVGTPAYMSPEQADPTSMDIDTRTDVYALGVMLYELLAGSPPLDVKHLGRGGLLEVMRMVREVEPPRPSTRLGSSDGLPAVAANRGIGPAELVKSLRGDLDWVVMKALEKDRARRYDTAAAFARDIERYLADEVVEARPPSAGYRLMKFVKRHRGQVIAASLVLLALVGGIVFSTHFAFEARFQANEAEANAKTADDNAKNEAAERRRATAAEGDAIHRLANGNFLLAAHALESRAPGLAFERLLSVPPRHRGWEWHYLWHKASGGIFTLRGHSAPVTAVSYSPDGTRILTASQDGTAKVWDARTGALLLDLKAGSTWPMACAYSPDGKQILTAGDGAKVWDASTGALRMALKGVEGLFTSAAFSPDGKLIFCKAYAPPGERPTFGAWDARDGALQGALRGLPPGKVAFSPDGTRLLTYTDRLLYDPRSRGEAKVLPGSRELFKATNNNLSAAAFSPDGTRIVAAWGYPEEMKVLDARSARALVKVQANPLETTSCLAFSPDGSRAASAGPGPVNVWNARTGAPLAELVGHTSGVRAVAFSPDGARIVSGDEGGAVIVWDARSGSPPSLLTGVGASFSPDGTRIATISARQAQVERGGGGPFVMLETVAVADIRLWDVRSHRPVLEMKVDRGNLGVWNERAVSAFSVDGKVIRAGDGSWDARTGRPAAEPKGRAPSPDGSRVVTWEGVSAKVLDARTGAQVLELAGHAEKVEGATFSPDGTRIITFGGKEVKAWDALTGTHSWDMNAPLWQRRGAISPDCTRIITAEGPMAKVWDARTGELELTLKGHTVPVFSMAFSPDGRRIVTGGCDVQQTSHRSGRRPAEVKVWDARTGTPLLGLKEDGRAGPPLGTYVFGPMSAELIREDRVKRVAFSPDGTRLLASGSSNTAVWDARRCPPLTVLSGHASPIEHLAFSPDSTRIVTGSPDGTVKVWDAGAGKVLLSLTEGGSVTCVAYSPDGSRIATGSRSGTAKVWDARTGALLLDLLKLPQDEQVTGLSYSPDGARIVTRTLKFGRRPPMQWSVWDAKTGAEVKGATRTDPLPGSRISPDGRTAAQVEGGHVVLYPVRPDEDELAYRMRHTEAPGTEYFRQQYRAAQAAGDDFAARFHLDRLPPPDRATMLMLTYARCRSEANRDPRNPAVHAALADVLSDRGQKKEAAAAYHKAVELAPMNAAALAEALRARGRIEGAIACCRKGSELDPKGRALHLMLGDMLTDTGRTAEAVASYAKASELDPSDTVLSLKVAALQAWFRQEKDFALTRQRILAFAKGTRDAGHAERAARACSLLPSSDKAELDAALALGREGMKVHPWDMSWPRVALGTAQYRAGNFGAADRVLAAVGPYPAQPIGISGYYRAMCLFRQGKPDQARKLADRTAANMKPLPADEKNPLADGAHPDDLILWLAHKEAKTLLREPKLLPPPREER
jgi:WD40 repeat protein/tetratricopeptide (TPR) repeat protein